MSFIIIIVSVAVIIIILSFIIIIILIRFIITIIIIRMVNIASSSGLMAPPPLALCVGVRGCVRACVCVSGIWGGGGTTGGKWKRKRSGGLRETGGERA